ncbi:TPA: hypothetical protein I8Y21_004290 [Klebsiella oxytoca]|uniref:Uncharacterized protein n=1 Tax=Klebsiella oxytoca TaxID=571 RepID=A0AAN5LAW0_KLEOX|nr:hypothetical protein [Klebsiella oxytoca]
MTDNRTTSAIDESFRIVQSPVFVVSRHGYSKRCLSRSAAINNLAHYMVTRTFHLAGIETNEPVSDESGRPVAHSTGPHTQQYLFAHNRCARRVRRILARKRDMQNWHAKWKRMHDRYIKERDELQATKPQEIR